MVNVASLITEITRPTKEIPMEESIRKARAIMEAMPFIRKFNGNTIVIKYGGHAMDDPAMKEKTILDFTLMKLVGIRPIIVHGGGPHITDLMKRLGKEAVFVEGHRITDNETMDITEMVLSGHLNKDIAAQLNLQGANAVGISGRDANLIVAKKKTDKSGKGVDLGQVGEIDRVNTEILIALTQGGYLPVVSPVAVGEDGLAYNVNADTAAGAIAAQMRARRLIYMTDVRGIYEDLKDESSFIQSLNEKRLEQLKKDGRISEGMIPKIESAFAALKSGVEKVHVIDGRIEHSLILELFTEEGIGTEIVL